MCEPTVTSSDLGPEVLVTSRVVQCRSTSRIRMTKETLGHRGLEVGEGRTRQHNSEVFARPTLPSLEALIERVCDTLFVICPNCVKLAADRVPITSHSRVRNGDINQYRNGDNNGKNNSLVLNAPSLNLLYRNRSSKDFLPLSPPQSCRSTLLRWSPLSPTMALGLRRRPDRSPFCQGVSK